MTNRPEAASEDVSVPVRRGGLEMEDLAPRLVSALILIPAALAAAVAGGPWLAGAAGAATVAMSYEWARMSEPDQRAWAFGLCLTGALGAVMAQSWGATDLAFLALAIAGAVSALRRRSLVAAAETFLGVIYIGAPCILFLWLRSRAPGGMETVLSLFVIVWAADVAAYFGGKLVGGPKFAPQISPSKTWSGTLSGLAAGAGAGGAIGLALGAGAIPWFAAGFALAVVSLGGDLLESALKRRFGVKDASRLIPGHGGVLDRLDGLMTATAATALAAWAWPGLVARLVGGA